jgi:6-phospho-beta-glucosidase
LKIAILGAGGVRTPLIVGAMARRAQRLGLTELTLMDVDAERLDIIGALAQAQQDSLDALTGESRPTPFRIMRTTDARAALAGADFVITTFRVGGIASRVVDERVPLRHGVLGQETTGPGGFAMAMRTIPVLLDYLATMREVCPDAWLINFANPAGLLAEAAITAGGWARTVGICDAPEGMRRVAAALFGVTPDELYLDYFGLNHLGWVRAAFLNGQDLLPRFIAMLRVAGTMPGLPFGAAFIASLSMIPNEYLFYYYHSREAVNNILRGEMTRGEQIAGWNALLFDELTLLRAAGDTNGMRRTYKAYLEQRGGTYMASETGQVHDVASLDPAIIRALAGEGYAGIALDLIEGLSGSAPRQMILNVPNAGAIRGMEAHDVVEVPVFVGKGMVRPLAVGEVPRGSLGLMQQVKAYEQLTIAAATEGAYAKAVQALTLHPLVQDYAVAVAILEGYREGHGASFPALM